MILFLIIIIIISWCVSVYTLLHTHKVNIKIDEINNQKQSQYLECINKQQEIVNEIEKSEILKNQLSQSIDEKTNYLSKLENSINTFTQSIDNQMEISNVAFDNYWKTLENNYQQKEQEWDDLVEQLNSNYILEKQKLKEEIENINAELDKIRATKAASMAALMKEKEIKEKLSFYCLKVSATDLADIQKLENIKSSLNNPRILSMLIWSTFFQKSMTALCNNILGTSVITGIYKITNQTNDMCYIGQSVDISKRWKDHAKCGLGIDTPQGNKLYKAMIEDGIWNFSWELLEECPKQQLDEKEKYYINLYQSKEFGYNTTAGNK